MNCKYVAFIIISFFVSRLAQAQTALAKFNVGDPAPPVKVSNWYKGEKLERFEKGKVYVVEFWATWCVPCIAGMPHLSELARQYKGKVNFTGISVIERTITTPAIIQKFVDSMGNKMDYHVGGDGENYMKVNWLEAANERGIPIAFIVDQRGNIAWKGLPKQLDAPLAKVVNGTWDIAAESTAKKEKDRLSIIDNAVRLRMNNYMGNPGNADSALLEIKLILQENPGLKYYQNVGHFTFFSLIKSNPTLALQYAKEWLAANETPSWKTITDAMIFMRQYYVHRDKVVLPKELYLLTADCYQAQIDNYPASMNLPNTYKDMAALYFSAGDKAKAVEHAQKAIAAARQKTNFPANQLTQLEKDLQNYQTQ